MALNIICVFVVLAAVAGAAPPTPKPMDVKEAFVRLEVVPDVVDSAPETLIKVEYKKTKKDALLGNELKPKEVEEAPMVSYEADPKAFYALLMVDPDAPSRKAPKMREWEHWTVVNIPGADVAKGQVLAPYQGSAPPKNTGLHRYVFLVFKQEGKVEFHEPAKGPNRGKFSAKKFAEKYKLGKPVAGNVFQAQFDEGATAINTPKKGHH